MEEEELKVNENLNIEAWLDEHPEFVQQYFNRKASRQMIDTWLMSHASSSSSSTSSSNLQEKEGSSSVSNRSNSGTTTPVRKISAHEFERRGLLKPMVTNTRDGTPTFLTESSCVTLESISTGTVAVKSRSDLCQLDEKELIFELVKDICTDLDVKSLCHKILQNVSILLHADRGSLFLVQGDRNNGCEPGKAIRDRCLVSKLFDVCSQSTICDITKQTEIRIPWGTGIVGCVAETGEPVNLIDAYNDKRFNSDIDKIMGYRTKTLLCMPIKDLRGDVIGVAQVINKLDDSPFTKADENIFQRYLQFCGIGLQNAQLYERSQLEIRRNQVLLDLARIIFVEQSTIEHVVFRILIHMQSLIQCQRVQILLLHQTSKASFSRVFDFEASDLQQIEGNEQRLQPFESRFPINSGITGFVATTGETVNIGNAYEDNRFDKNVDENTGFTHKNILCMPIKNFLGKIIGVIQLVNKYIDIPFTKNDENFVEAFAIFCGLAIYNTNMYEKAMIAIAKQNVTLEVLSYHASATIEDALSFKELKVPSSVHFHLYNFDFDDLNLTDEETLTACIRMFRDLELIEKFQIDYTVLCRWLLSVKKNYRNVTYHNWRHAFNVAQMMFAILFATKWYQNLFDELECLALLIACLCHDLDHRGTNNSFQIKASSALAQVYTTSTMEHHHFDQCLMILNSPGNQILANMSSENYLRIVKVLEDAILSTDLAVYFRKRTAFIPMIQNAKESFTVTDGDLWRYMDWKSEENREMLRAMLMTICDLSAITKPWEIEKRIADLVSTEFFQQGDIEKEELHITPMDIMNREKSDQLPLMQVGFIDSICLPIYQAFEDLGKEFTPLADGVRENRRNWLNQASETTEIKEIEDLDKSTDSIGPTPPLSNSSTP